MKQLMDRIAKILLEPVGDVVTAFLGGYTIVWGFWVFNPYVHTFSSAPLYSALVSFFPSELFWGGLAIIFGVLTILGLALNKRKEVYYGAGASAIHWIMIAFFYFMGDVTNTGGITSLFIAMLSTYIYLNAKINYIKDKEEDVLPL